VYQHYTYIHHGGTIYTQYTITLYTQLLSNNSRGTLDKLKQILLVVDLVMEEMVLLVHRDLLEFQGLRGLQEGTAVMGEREKWDQLDHKVLRETQAILQEDSPTLVGGGTPAPLHQVRLYSITGSQLGVTTHTLEVGPTTSVLSGNPNTILRLLLQTVATLTSMGQSMSYAQDKHSTVD
jgi:hypothetical protein